MESEVGISKSTRRAPRSPAGELPTNLGLDPCDSPSLVHDYPDKPRRNPPPDSSVTSFPETPLKSAPTIYDAADLFRDFPDEDACLRMVTERLWPNGLAFCVRCGIPRKHHRVSGRKAFACSHCGRHVYPLAETIFSQSKTPLRTWFYILYLMLSTRGKISAKQLQRESGITYKTAWRARGRILQLLQGHSWR